MFAIYNMDNEKVITYPLTFDINVDVPCFRNLFIQS